MADDLPKAPQDSACLPQANSRSGGDDSRPRVKARILIVEDDPVTAETLGWILQSEGLETSWVRWGKGALDLVGTSRFNLLLVDLRLPDISGIDVVRCARAAGDSTKVIVLSGFVTVSSAVQAMKLGASDVLEKPYDADELLRVVNSVLGASDDRGHEPFNCSALLRTIGVPTARSASEGLPGSVAERWARLVLRAIDAYRDPKTLDDWARFVGVSRSALCECCRLVHVSPHDARDLTRFVRAIQRSGELWQPETTLDVSDSRTLDKLLARAGLSSREPGVPTIEDLLIGQRWIPQSNPGLVALRALWDSAGGQVYRMQNRKL